MRFIDTHAHIDGPEYDEDRDAVISRARQAGAAAILVPAIDLTSSQRILSLCTRYPRFLYPMAGLHPEEVRDDWREQLAAIHDLLPALRQAGGVAIGEVGLDFYWSREYERQQLEAFEQQVCWSVETRLPLMLHCRKAQNEMVRILRRHADSLPGGVFHCFTGNAVEAAELLQFPGFVLGIGGVATFKKSPLAQMLAGPHPQSPTVPLDRIVLETDAPYMAPVPQRGQRNEPAYVAYVLQHLAQAYAVSPDELARRTTDNAIRVFHLKEL